MSNDRFSELSVFIRAVESGSFSAAGRQLDLSASAVSKTISRMEERLGVRLLNRTSRSPQFTYEGEVFIVGARRVMAAMDEAQRSLLELKSDLSGKLRIYTLPSFGYTLVPFLTQFVQRFPRVKIDIQLGAERVESDRAQHRRRIPAGRDAGQCVLRPQDRNEHAELVAVGLGPVQQRPHHRALAAGAVEHDDGLAEAFRELGGEGARHHVGGAAGSELDHKAQVAFGPFGQGAGAQRHQGQRGEGTAPGWKSISKKCHSACLSLHQCLAGRG